MIKSYYRYKNLYDNFRENVYLNSPITIIPKKFCFSETKCYCKKLFWHSNKIKKRRVNLTQGRPLKYPYKELKNSKLFKIHYDKKLSSLEKLLISSFKNKYLYYVIDDINSILHSKQFVNNDLLIMLYSSITWLHNNESINFFDIWINNICIQEERQINRFLKNTNKYKTWITLILYYKVRSPKRKPKILW